VVVFQGQEVKAWEPLELDCQPSKSPLSAQQEVAFWTVQFRLEELPWVMVVGLAEKERVGAGQAVT
jgi:hypothetical protein